MKLEPANQMKFESGKVYTHAQGLSCCFRQWRATHSHCRFLHGYALQVEIVFGATELDNRNWVQDFGGLKPIKNWLEATFDHKTLIALDDPQLLVFQSLRNQGILDLVEVDHVGCEAFAKMIYVYIQEWLGGSSDSRDIWVESVTVREHEGNFARYTRK